MQPAGALAEQPPQQPQQQTAQPLPQPVQPPPSMQRQQQQGEQQQQQQPLQQQPEHHQRQEPPGVSPATQALLSGEARGLESRRFEVAGVEVHIRQDLRGSNALRPLDDDRVWAGDAARGGDADAAAPPILTGGWAAGAACAVRKRRCMLPACLLLQGSALDNNTPAGNRSLPPLPSRLSRRLEPSGVGGVAGGLRPGRPAAAPPALRQLARRVCAGPGLRHR